MKRLMEQDMDIYLDILQRLAKRTIEYLKDDLLMNNLSDDFTLEDVNAIKHGPVTKFIDISGDVNATIAMSVTLETAHDIVKSFIYGEVSENMLDELAVENIAETLNVTLGNILQDLRVLKEGGSIEISTPYESDKSLILKQNTKLYLSKIKYQNQDILLSIQNKE